MLALSILIAQYPILRLLSSYLSTVDLLNLARSCKDIYSYIRASRQGFDVLKRDCLCDGKGLARRQNFSGLYRLYSAMQSGPAESIILTDEPIEVKLYATQCDAAGALPCRKCGINICEECRYYERELGNEHKLRRPHLIDSMESINVFCSCPDCDTRLEAELDGQFLNELCDCTPDERWICHQCVEEEMRFTNDYYDRSTAVAMDYCGPYKKTKLVTDDLWSRRFWCQCGASVPDETRPRCTWCKRRHLPESKWSRSEMKLLGRYPPISELNPCYPPYVGTNQPYPKLPYDGPIWQNSE